VRWNGQDRVTHFVGASEVDTDIPASDLQSANYINITVFTSEPGGGISNGLPFVVGTQLNPIQGIITNDLVFDSTRQRLYAAVPQDFVSSTGTFLSCSSNATTCGNVAVINPVTRTVVAAISTGSNPNKLALSDDGKYLYAATDTCQVVRIDLDTQAVDQNFSIGTDPTAGLMCAYDIAVMPGNNKGVAISRRFGSVPGSKDAGVGLYQDGVLQTNASTPATSPGVIEFGTADRLYEYFNQSFDPEFRRFGVDTNGLTELDSTTGLITTRFADIHFEGGRLYSTSGVVLDPEAKTILGRFDGVQFGKSVAIDSTLAKAYFLVNSLRDNIVVYDLNSHEVKGAVPLGNTGAAGMVQWAQDKLAVRTVQGTLLFVDTTSLLTATALHITTSSLPQTSSGKQYQIQLQSSATNPNGVGWTLASGSLPPGLNLSQSGTIAGTVGSVSADTTYTFEVAANASGLVLANSTRSLSILVKSGSLGRNDDCASATGISNGVVRASISPHGDLDVYSFAGTAGQQVRIETSSQRLSLPVPSRLDTVVQLLDSSCNQLAFSDDIDLGVVTDSLIDGFTLPYTGTYYIRVMDFRGDGRPDFIYDLSLTGAN
jgi:hypothetical protein